MAQYKMLSGKELGGSEKVIRDRDKGDKWRYRGGQSGNSVSEVIGYL